ncbi:eCIS core domain-containing protein [Streptomyces pristinaespiralis]|uniref:eCIS core domain-containing protein n=1 Tax=Streptomyces pristinaespiralis TaxID=38300 RepID=UPI0038396690
MSTSHSQESRSDQAGKRRKRKDRDRSGAPEPKNIVSGAGQPLDLSVRRELEEQLGHDFGRVRLHTDRDAGTLTEMLGADAVAVGQDIFFREGAYRPGTLDGQRLLAHELLHTVQNPHGLGTLRAGRDAGAVSLPQQAMEREAESAAQSLVREEEAAAPEVEPGAATPGWLRYARVDADRSRLEQIDPATLVDRLANGVARSLRGDPEDRSKRTRRQLARLPEELRDSVLDRLESRLLSSEHERLLDIVDELDGDEEQEQEQEQGSLDAPHAESDLFDEVAFEREQEQRAAEEEQQDRERPAPAPGPEKDRTDPEGAPGSTPQNGGTAQDGTTPQGGQAPRGGEQSGADGGQASAGQEQAAPASAPQQEQSQAAAGGAGGASSGSASAAGQQAGEKKESGAQGGKEGEEQQAAEAPSEEESAAKNRPGAVDALTAGQRIRPEDRAGQEKPGGSPTAAGNGVQDPGPFSRLDGVRNQDLDGPREEAEEELSDSTSEMEVGGGEKSAWDIKLQPEDFLPAQDLDVSGVPTADDTDPSTAPAAPSFPAPPVTRADKVQAERDAEDAEDAAAGTEEDGADALDVAEAPEADEEGIVPGDGEPGGLAMEKAAAAPPVPAPASKDPKNGADPKAGPVAAQTAVQEKPGTSESGDATQEAAAKEEKGTPAAGDRPVAAQEKSSPQAAGGKAAPESAAKQEQKPTAPAPAATGEQAAGAPAPSPARDTHVTGGSNTDTSGGTSSDAAGEAQGPSSDPAPAQSTQSNPAPAPPPAPAPAKAPAAAPAPETAPSPKAAPSRRPAPAPRTPQGGGGSRGRGGAVAAARKAKKDSGPAPNLSAVSPEAGLSTASKLKPHKALEAMGGVGGSVDRTVGDEHKTLASAPPSMQRPAGAPKTLEGKPNADAPAQYSQDPAQKSEAPKDEEAKVTGAKEPEGQIEAEKAEEPGGWDTFKMALGFGIGKVLSWVGFEVDAQELAAKFAGLPTKDEALKQAQAGNAPGVEMSGAAEQTAGEQGTAVDTKGQDTVTTAREDSARGMGEDQVYPNAPKQQMKGKVPGPDGGKGGVPEGGASTGAVPPEAASEVAEHDSGPQFQRAFGDGQKGMSEGRQTKDRDFRDSQSKHKAKVDAEIATNTQSQTGEREKALSDVNTQREDWRKEQDEELKNLGTKKTERQDKVRKDVKDREEKTDKDVTKEKEDGDKKIKDENTKAERDAEKKRDDSVSESGNWITKAFDWIKQKVIEIKDAIVRVIKAARDAVVGFIKNFKETVERWINEARKFIVDTIKNLIDDLIEFAKNMVRAVIELANRIRKFITSLIEAAIALVNKLATALKQIITDLLDAIAKLLSDILSVLKKMLMDVIKAVVDAIKTVLDHAAKLLSALGDFMLIAVDFLSDPGGWLSGAKNSAVDGAKNHLFREVQAAVKSWFQSKIEEIIGIPKAIIEKLIKGGYTLEKIVKETWDAIVPQLPFIIGEIVITKVVAKLIPGAGWAMAVIDAIKVAIGALGEILRAIGAVITWLKAVRQGGAGILFAKAVAAGIVALLELAYEALLSGIGKYVAKVGQRLKGVAADLGKPKGDKDKSPAPPAAPPGDKRGPGKDQQGQNQPATTPATTPKKPTSPAPGKDRTPQDRPRTTPPGKPKDTTPGPAGPKPSNGDRKPAADNRNGKPQDRTDDKPDTRPTPSPKPKAPPTPQPKPKPDPTPAPKPKNDTPGRPQDNKDSTRPKDDQDTTAPKPDDKATPTKPKDTDPTKPKDQDAPGKPPKPKDADGKGPKPDKDGIRPGPRPSKPGKTGPGRPKSRSEKDDRRADENGKDAKEDRLRRIIARIRPIINGKLEPGISQNSHEDLLDGLRAHYGLTSLRKSNREDFTIVARLNPSGVVTRGYTDRQDHNDYRVRQDDDDLPPTRVPEFKDRVLPSSFKGQFINKKYSARGQYPSGDPNRTKGFDYIDRNGLQQSWPGQWDRMHLLPRELGGPNRGSNYVPARNPINKNFYDVIESHAASAFGQNSPDDPKIPGWYRITVALYPGGHEDKRYPPTVNHPLGEFPEGFPQEVKAEWGLYQRKGGANRTGKSATDWKELKGSMAHSYSTFERPPIPGTPAVLTNVSTEKDVGIVRKALNETPEFAKAVIELAPFGGDINKLINKMSSYRSGNRSHTRFNNLKERLEQVKQRYPMHFTL